MITLAVLLSVQCGVDDKPPKLTELGSDDLEQTCEQLNREYLEDATSVDGICKLWAANMIARTDGPTGGLYDDGACEAVFASCPRDEIHGAVCPNRFEAAFCKGTLADLMECGELIRMTSHLHAQDTCFNAARAVGQIYTMRSDREETPCDRAWTCFPRRVEFQGIDGGVPLVPSSQ
jgi:hypothetical protein